MKERMRLTLVAAEAAPSRFTMTLPPSGPAESPAHVARYASPILSSPVAGRGDLLYAPLPSPLPCGERGILLVLCPRGIIRVDLSTAVHDPGGRHA